MPRAVRIEIRDENDECEICGEVITGKIFALLYDDEEQEYYCEDCVEKGRVSIAELVD